MGDATVNGDMPQSAFLEHIHKYPIVSDSVSAFKSNPYGQKSIDLTNAGYTKFVKPTFPYLEKPASYAKPYASKADELAENLLTKFDEKVPIVKSETHEIKTTVFDYAGWPFKKYGESKDYVLSTYNEEYKKCGGNGYVAGGKAVISSSFVISAEWLAWVGSLLQQKKAEFEESVKKGSEEVKEKTKEKTNN